MKLTAIVYALLIGSLVTSLGCSRNTPEPAVNKTEPTVPVVIQAIQGPMEVPTTPTPAVATKVEPKLLTSTAKVVVKPTTKATKKVTQKVVKKTVDVRAENTAEVQGLLNQGIASCLSALADVFINADIEGKTQPDRDDTLTVYRRNPQYVITLMTTSENTLSATPYCSLPAFPKDRIGDNFDSDKLVF